MKSKLISLFLLILIWLLLEWCQNLKNDLLQNEIADEWQLWIEKVLDSDEETWILDKVLSSIDITKLSKDELNRYIMATIPECKIPDLIPYQLTKNISDLVENCTTKKKQWSFPDGLWWVFLNSYSFDQNSNSVISLTENFSLDEIWELKVDWNIPVCMSHLNWYLELWYPIINQSKFSDDSALSLFWRSGSVYALEKALSVWWMKEIYYIYDDGQLYINPDDDDLKINYEIWARSDGKNYFVGWKDLSDSLVYLINDYYFNPGKLNKNEINLFDTNSSWNSIWYFGGVKDGKIIVNRFKDYHYLWYPVTVKQYIDWNYYDQEKNASEFILETCEISLDKIK